MQEEIILLEKFCRENPLDFVSEEFEKVKQDIMKPKKGVVSDEYVAFRLWTKGMRTRQEYFADYVKTVLPCEVYHKLLEVGCGRKAGLARCLAQAGYDMTAMDTCIELTKEEDASFHCRKESFCFGKTDITAYDAVVAQEPCEATEHIIRACVAAEKNFVISLCGVPHPLINGEMPADAYAWYHYLQAIDSQNCFLVQPQIIRGYRNYVMLGIFDSAAG